MASFWDLVNEIKAETTGSVEIAVGGEPIPDGTTALAAVVEAKWQKGFNQENEFLSIQWEVLEPESLRGRKTFVKHWVKDLDASAKDAKAAENKLKKALQIFSNIDYNTGGRIVKHLSEKQDWPTIDQINMALTGKPMLIHFQEWVQENGNRGNYITGAFPKGDRDVKVGSGNVKPMKDNRPQQHATTTTIAASPGFEDDSIPW